MTRQRILWFGLLAVQAVSLGIVSKTVVFPLLIGIAALIGTPGWFVRPITRRTRIIVWVLLAVALVLKWRVFPLGLKERVAVFPSDYSLMHAVAQGLLLAQVIESYLPGSDSRMKPGRFSYGGAFCALAAMVCMFDFIALERTNYATLALSVVFCLMFIPYLATMRRDTEHVRGGWLRAVSLFLLLTAGLGAGCAGSLVLYQRIMSLDRILAGVFLPAATNTSGFSNRATLDSVEQRRQDNAKSIMLRVKSEQPPEHLRALAYEKFTGKEWTRPATVTDCLPSDAPEEIRTGNTEDRFFQLMEQAAGPWRMMDVWADASLRDVVFKPLSTVWVGAPVDTLSVDENLAVSAAGLPPRQPYRIAEPTQSVRQNISDDMRARYTAVPDGLDPRIKALADTVAANCPTNIEKARALERYFSDNYHYDTGISIPPGREPLSYFLFDHRAAHCEFFAAATTILLRLSGVPCRYVTGFLVTERNPVGDYWVARNRDAHAWAEAWDESTGWVTVDTTPGSADGAPGGSKVAYWWDAVRFGAAALVAGVRAAVVAVVGVVFRYAYRLLPVITAVGVLAVVVAAYRVLRRRMPKRAAPVSADVVQMRRLLRKMDQRLRAKGFQRNRTETLSQFAQRIGTIPGMAPFSDWYQAYARIRYAGEIAAEDVLSLGNDLRLLLSRPRS